MPGLDELMARGDAAGGSMRDVAPGDPAGAGADNAPPEAQPSDDLDGALAQVESIIEGMNPDIADQAREHLNAIRELAASAAPQGGPDQGGSQDQLPPPDMGSMSDVGAMTDKAPPK